MSNGQDRALVRPGTLSALQREHVLAVLESTHGNKEQAARLLGISRRTLYRLLNRYGVLKSGPRAFGETLDPAQQ